jgi:hypothetical protein
MDDYQNDSHYGLIQDNIMYNCGGACFMTEDGSESFNVIEHNFAVRSYGSGGRDHMGREATGFWLRGGNNYVRRNVAANFPGDSWEANHGYSIWQQDLAMSTFPTSKVPIRSQQGTTPLRWQCNATS